METTHHRRSPRLRRLIVLLAGALVALSGMEPISRAHADPPALTRPVDGALRRGFDAPRTRWGPGHRGVDLQAPPGTRVRAAADGVVAFVGDVAGRPVVSVDHDRGGVVHRTTYQPVLASVSEGTRVGSGQVIGTIADSRECPGGCLHWGLRIGHDTYLDPMQWLQGGSVRLLPMGARARPAPVVRPVMDALLGLSPPGLPSSGLRRPTSGPVTSRFGPRLHPIFHVWRMHDGVDLGDPCGRPVASSAAGRVVGVEHHLGYGLRVIVDHGTIRGHRMRSAYNHLSSTVVRPGQLVEQGQAVGRVGSTGWSTGCHLHWMVWADGAVVDPLAWT